MRPYGYFGTLPERDKQYWDQYWQKKRDEKGEQTKAEFTSLANLIENGSLNSRHELQEEITKRSWVITKEGDDYFNIRTLTSKFRFRFDFDETAGEGWIYALVAYSTSEKACYIGYTKNFPQRMFQHQTVKKRLRFHENRTSSDLFKWANMRSLTVNVLTLERVLGISMLVSREAAWTKAAKSSDWYLPGVERWGSNAARPIVQSELAANTPYTDIPNFSLVSLANAIPLDEVVKTAVPPISLCAS